MSEDDILRAIGKLKALGSGFQVVKIGSQKLVRSVPGELNTDKSVLLELAQGSGYVSEAQIEQVLTIRPDVWVESHLCKHMHEVAKV